MFECVENRHTVVHLHTCLSPAHSDAIKLRYLVDGVCGLVWRGFTGNCEENMYEFMCVKGVEYPLLYSHILMIKYEKSLQYLIEFRNPKTNAHCSEAMKTMA